MTDEQLWDLYRERGDERGSIKLLVSHSHATVHESSAGEAKEDYLDKGSFSVHFFSLPLVSPLSSSLAGVDWVQEHVMGQGPQNNESAAEQFKDEQISDFIRGQYKGATGSEFPVKDKS